MYEVHHRRILTRTALRFGRLETRVVEEDLRLKVLKTFKSKNNKTWQ